MHEELLIQIRRVMPDSELKSDPDGSGPLKFKHARWRSVDSPSVAIGAGTMHVARRSIEATWFGRPKRGVLVSEPREVAEVAKVFGRLVRDFFGPLQDHCSENRCCSPDGSILCLRGIWRQVRIDAVGDDLDFEDHTQFSNIRAGYRSAGTLIGIHKYPYILQ